MSKKTCQVCQNIMPLVDSGEYCELHRQIYDSLVVEFDAVKKTSKGLSVTWKKFPTKKMDSVSYLPKELGDVIKIGLESTQI
jgi:hypothetical protein